MTFSISPRLWIINGIAGLAILSSCGSTSMLHKRITTEDKCNCKKDSYWYENQCWKDYEDEAISINDIDSVVNAEMIQAEAANIFIRDKSYPIDIFFPIPEDDVFIILLEYTDEGGRKSMLSQIPIKKMRKENISTDVLVLNGTIMGGELDSIPFGNGTVDFKFTDEGDEVHANGTFTTSGDSNTVKFNYTGSESLSGLGDSKLEIIGDEAFLSGDLGTKTYRQIKDLIDNHPNVKTLVLTTISGSVNDAVNMHTGRLVHEAKLNTKVLADSDIASGAVDLFCAGENRIVEQGAKIGIHSWCCVNDLTAIELPKDHPAHKDQLNYFTLIMGKGNGPAFYYHTLSAAPFDGVHWMSDEDIQSWKVSTQFIQN
ncbi:MAG: hypothetical protein COA38_05955 [Fluviicola sp.]|nr:MAG: hypothetical protein COA38_05955 [Fluviicola sp.]